MMSITAVFWMLVVIFGIIGGFRGWAKEVLVLFSLILALFLMRVLQQYVPGVQAALDAQGPQQQVILPAASDPAQRADDHARVLRVSDAKHPGV